ncbi:pituitary tumor-transforming gene 1 protein-interacting protein-like [Sinocyclocheilus anshuiensis]|uniref:Pituitary tumor-transforming gene 1 protein-interacting protein-like n=1 Tax=Sinocyclocheilus anshuiensis TaxID=1608454 RepID=A0A671TA02_9TELE|nr:PREDICTED: pituitary tumor-transforming gene 1 protein-interacting protein-like [Sinocyclocheilus anshuiensis]
MNCIPLVLLLSGLSSTLAQNTISTDTTTQTTQSSTTQTTSKAPTTTPHPSCESKDGTTCEECLAYVDCLWCIPTKTCITYPAKTILPPHSLCPLNNARWGLCTINFQILIITLSVAAALLIIGFLLCIFCCCKCENIGSARFQNRMNRQSDKTKTKQEQRKTELKIRHDEIRQKYGLSRASPYARFDNPS